MSEVRKPSVTRWVSARSREKPREVEMLEQKLVVDKKPDDRPDEAIENENLGGSGTSTEKAKHAWLVLGSPSIQL
jgi:hypothetical protein